MKKRNAFLIFAVVPIVVLLLPLVAKLKNQQQLVAKPKTVPAYKPQSGPTPRFVTYFLGGRHIRDNDWGKYGEQVFKCDSKSEYCIASKDGPDGCEYISELKPDYDHYSDLWADSRKEFDTLYKGVRVPLTTGNGVRIGDTIQQVEKKIGQPTKKFAFRTGETYDYEYRGKRLYNAHYYFEKGKLREIKIRDARPPSQHTGPNGGCG